MRIGTIIGGEAWDEVSLRVARAERKEQQQKRLREIRRNQLRDKMKPGKI